MQPDGMGTTKFAKYTLLEHMGKGGMASVYRASDNDDGSIVAVKIFETTEERPAETTRKLLDREVRMLVSVQHPNIIKFHESGYVDEDYYYAMEFVEHSLQERIRANDDFDVLDKVVILRQTASALAAIHHQGIVHRDIKPGNILLDQDPNGAIHVKLTDLGIAKNVSETDIVQEQMPTKVPGTAKYLSPEQIRLQAVDGRADIFGLGIVAYELLVGTHPFKAKSADEYLKANRTQKQVSVHKVDESIPPFLGQMVDRMLVKDREDRYDSDTLSRDLELVQQHLVSGAPLVERIDQASMFYEPPPAREGAPAREVAPRRTLSPLTWAGVLVIVLIGTVFCIVLWPDRQGGGPGRVVQASEPGPEELLALAGSALADGHYWQAVAIAAELQDREISAAARRDLDDLSLRSQEALAQDRYTRAKQLLADDRIAEAEVELALMEEFMPRAERTRSLEATLRARREAKEDKWESALHETYALVRSRRYQEALAARAKLLASAGADAGKEAAARRAIADLFENWGDYLLRAYPESEPIEEFLQALTDRGDWLPADGAPKAAGSLRLQLAELYRKREDFSGALAQYELAAADADPQVAAQADRAGQDLATWLSERPYDAAALGRELKESGFAGDLWVGASQGGSQQVVDGTLRLAATGEAAARVECRTVRPVRNLGFSAGVSFRASEALTAAGGSARAGIGLRGADGREFTLAFDGGAYTVDVAKGADQMTAGRVVREAFGDEAAEWHVLGIRYDFNTGRLAAQVDGETVLRYSLDVGDFRLRAFLEAEAGSSAEAAFRDVYCRP